MPNPDHGDRARPGRSLLPRSVSRHQVGVAAVTALAGLAYALLGLVQLRNNRATIFDLVIFDQTIRNYAEFRPPMSPALGAFHGTSLDYLQLAEHFSPILATLTPLYWIHDGPASLILAQSALFSLAIPPIWRFARRKLGTVPAYLVVASYATSTAIAQAAVFDFHEVAFVPVLTAVMIERFDAGKPFIGSLAAAGLLLVKEDMGLLVAGFGCFLLATRRFRPGIGFVVGGLGMIALTRGVFIPAAGGDPATFWAYNYLGRNVPEVLSTAVTNPGLVLHSLVNPPVKVATMLGLVAPVAFACLLSPLVLPAVPLILERMLSDRPFWWTNDFQYDAFVIVVVISAAVDGIARIQRWMDRRHRGHPPASVSRSTPLGLAWAALVCGISLALVPQNALGRLLQPAFYRADFDAVAAAEAAATIPSGVVVESVNNMGPALTRRATVVLWQPQSYRAAWVLANTERLAYPFASVDQQREKVAELVDSGYEIVYERDGYVVLHRPDGTNAKAR